MEQQGAAAGPVVWLTGCMHGDEVGGIVVIQEVFRRLRKEPLLKGSLHAFPLMNPVGFENTSRHVGVSREDLNRSFPGKKKGSMAERIAWKILSDIQATRPSLVLDLHNDWINSVPYALLDAGEMPPEVRERIIAFASRTGLITVRESADPSELRKMAGSFTGCLAGLGVPAFTLELGEARVVNEMNVADGLRAVWSILASLEMVAPQDEALHHPAPEKLRGKVLNYSHEPVASSSGIVRFLAQPGQTVKKGQSIARVYNVFGKLVETIHAGADAVVLGFSDTSVAMPGLPVMAFGAIEPTAPVPSGPAVPAPPKPTKEAAKG